MTFEESSREAEIEQASNALSDGLKTCRSVLNDYRATLSGDASSQSTEAQGSTDHQSRIDVLRAQHESTGHSNY